MRLVVVQKEFYQFFFNLTKIPHKLTFHMESYQELFCTYNLGHIHLRITLASSKETQPGLATPRPQDVSTQ
jgi:hypothetical protein